MTDVIVVGAGIIGLTAAVRLQERDARVTVWTAHEPAATVSATAAAIWYPSRTAAGPRLLGWAAKTHEVLTRQAGAGVPGELRRRTRMLLRTPISTPPWWAEAAGGVEIRDAAEGVQELRFDAPMAEMDTYLGWLCQRVVEAGGRIERRTVTSLNEADSPVVVNATGLAAGALCADPDVYPARGHVVLVANPGIQESVRDEQNPAGVTYVHPRSRDVVLGGTFAPGRTDTAPDPAEAAAIISRCEALVPELAAAPIRAERIGLRPERRGGPRVEAESTADGRRTVHAYGHGGAGVTLAWGCADEVAGLALA